MSSLEIYRVEANGDVTLAGKARNSYGGAMHIWMTLAEKYQIRVSRSPFASDGGFDPVWTAWRRMSRWDAWVMRGTFDQVIIPPESFTTYLTALQQFTAEHPTATLTEAITILDTVMREPDIRGICFNQTSVNADAWEGPYDEASEDYLPYNIDKADDHWFLTAESFEQPE